MSTFCSSLSFSRNSIYSIHYSYYSFSLSSSIGTIFLSTFLFLAYFSSPFIDLLFLCLIQHEVLVVIFIFLVFNWLILFISFEYSIMFYFWSLIFLVCFSLLSFTFYYLFLGIFGLNLVLFTSILFLWINDYSLFESMFGFSFCEQGSLIYGINLVIFSELLLFIACFWGVINFSFILNAYSLFFCFPLLSSYSFAIPYSNVVILLFSSLPIQSATIFYNVGLFIGTLEQLSQTISCGIVFLVLQINEFFYSYLSISDACLGSIFYFTTTLHMSHVIIGCIVFFCLFVQQLDLLFLCWIIDFSFYWVVIILLLFLYSYFSLYSIFTSSSLYHIYYSSVYYALFNDFSFSLYIASVYWHFVDLIWIIVFFLFFV